MSFARVLNKFNTMPFTEFFLAVLKRLHREFYSRAKKYGYLYFYRDSLKLNENYQLNSCLCIECLDYEQADNADDSTMLGMYISHRFDLLGSGWVKAGYDSEALGIAGIKYDGRAKYDKNELVLPSFYDRFTKTVSLIGEAYEPIDWQKDFKSGYRWSAKEWYLDCREVVGVKKGVDIKFPWELARMQHLPYIAVCAVSRPNDQKRIIEEFKNQVLDFISTNPPLMGVNWTCTMDVGIRAANIIIAYDILNQLDIDNLLTPEFTQILAQSMFEHGEHIVNNLEWSDRLTSNHYLANVVGLLFIASYLEGSKTVDNWLAFSVQEVLDCIEQQFHNDGSNFEASTSYHRLSGEMVVYGIAIMLGLSQAKLKSLLNYNHTAWSRQPRLKAYNEQVYSIENVEDKLRLTIPDSLICKIYSMGRFSEDITNHLQTVVQIGDNDSGRFIKVSSQGELISNLRAEYKYKNLKGYCKHIESLSQGHDEYWDENELTHSAFISAVDSLFKAQPAGSNGKKTIEAALINALCRGNLLNLPSEHVQDTIPLYLANKEFKLAYQQEYQVPFDRKIDSSILKPYFYPQFGICGLKGEDFFLSAYFGSVGQKGNGGHAHNDKLSFELVVGTERLFFDPGSYLYTPDLEQRDFFRSIASHNSPRTVEGNREQNRFLSRFSMSNETSCELLEFTQKTIKMKMEYDRVVITRTLKLEDNELNITDESNVPLRDYLCRPLLFSPGYGKLQEINNHE